MQPPPFRFYSIFDCLELPLRTGQFFIQSFLDIISRQTITTYRKRDEFLERTPLLLFFLLSVRPRYPLFSLFISSSKLFHFFPFKDTLLFQ